MTRTPYESAAARAPIACVAGSRRASRSHSTSPLPPVCTTATQASAPTSHNAADPAELNVVCRSKPNLPNQTDLNAAVLPYPTHQLGSAHEWSGVWNGPKA